MTSSLFARTMPRASRPRRPAGETSPRFNLTLPESTKFQLEQAATAENVSLSYLFCEGALRLARLAYEERELGLVPVPARLSVEQLSLIATAAQARGITVDRWVVHALMDAVAASEPEAVAA